MRRFMLSFTLLIVILCSGCGSDGEKSVSGSENPAVEQGSFEENAGDTTLSSEEDSEAGKHGEGMQNVPEEDDIPDTTLPLEEDFEAENHDDAMTQEDASEWEDHVLLTVEAPLADGRTFTLEAVGKRLDEYSYGVREVRVYDGDMLIQTVFTADAGEDFLSDVYTWCWTVEDTMAVLDLNLDGNADFGLFGWAPNNTIPYHYWTWDEEQGFYRYACTLQGVELHTETGEISAGYKSGGAGSQYTSDYFCPNEDGELFLVRREISDMRQSSDVGYPALEVWMPQEGVEIPAKSAEDIQSSLILVRREIPVMEVYGDNSVHYFLEIWELNDGVLQMTSREEYDFE